MGLPKHVYSSPFIPNCTLSVGVSLRVDIGAIRAFKLYPSVYIKAVNLVLIYLLNQNQSSNTELLLNIVSATN